MSNLQRLFLVICILMTTFLSLGCGGGGSESFSTNPSGVYSMPYTRADGTVQIVINGSNIGITIFDEAGTFTGTGSVSNREFSVVCTDQDSDTVTATGEIVQLHNGDFQIFLSVDGAFTVGGVATYQGETVAALYAGTYTGTNAGDMTGSFTLTVNPNGRISIVTHLNSETVNNTWSGSGDFGSGHSQIDVTVDIEPGGSVLYRPQFAMVNGVKYVTGAWMANDWNNEGGNALGTFSGNTLGAD